ncbi:MAG: hypothetical protein PVF45_13730, partial [Anaerolineae bacterium]
MTSKEKVSSLAVEMLRALPPFYQKALRQAIQESKAPDLWFFLGLARGSHPTPLSSARVHAIFPYNAREAFTGRLDKLAGLELLARVGEDAYVLTDLGREAIEGIFGAVQQVLGTVEPLPAGEMEQLDSLLYRIVEATLQAPEPQEKWALAYSRWSDPGAEGAGAVKTDQYLTDLARFRDDAHIAAWKPYGVSGQAWEALTFVWRDEASSAEELTAKLPYRDHTVEDYAQALQDLASRRWVVEETGVYKLTEMGKQIREEAEEATDRYFFVGWSALNDDELARLHDLLFRAVENLHRTARSQAWGMAQDVSQAIYILTRST